MARASVLTLAVASNVLIPFSPYLFFVFFDQFPDFLQFLAQKPMRFSKKHRIHPKFGILLRAFNMDMNRFFRLTTEKEKSVSMMAKYLRHGRILQKRLPQRSIFSANVPSDLSLLAFGIPPAREAESAGGMPKVPKGQGLGPLAR
jgi:hypothetical protein